MSDWLPSNYPHLRLGRNAFVIASQPIERMAKLSELYSEKDNRSTFKPEDHDLILDSISECCPLTSVHRVILQQLLLDNLPLEERERSTEWVVGRRRRQRRKLVMEKTSSDGVLLNLKTKDVETFLSYARWAMSRLQLHNLSDSVSCEYFFVYFFKHHQLVA